MSDDAERWRVWVSEVKARSGMSDSAFNARIVDAYTAFTFGISASTFADMSD